VLEKECGEIPGKLKPVEGEALECEKTCNKLFQDANNDCKENCGPTPGPLSVCTTAARAALYACYSACLEPWANGGKDDPKAGTDAFNEVWELGKCKGKEKKK
jgi:hypothetical protein